MKFIYSSRDMAVTDSLKSRVEKKLAKFERFFRDEPEANIRFKIQKGGRNTCEVTINANGVILRAEETSNDMYLSIDRASDKLESQLRRYHTKLENRVRVNEPELAEEAPIFEEQKYDIVRVKKFSVKPMSIEDAITQMELLGHDFFLFINEEAGDTMNVLYRRQDGTYGLLQPE